MAERTHSNASFGTVTPDELKARIEDGADTFLVDVRSPAEYEDWHITGEGVESVNVPVNELMNGLTADAEESLPADRKLTVVCAKGQSSQSVAQLLSRAGYDVNHLEYGMQGWAQVYEFTELDVDTDAFVGQYARPSSGCLAYLIVDGGEAAVIDPLRVFTDHYLQDLETLDAELVYAVDTHIHADHISGVRTLARQTGATAVIPDESADRGVDYDIDYETVTDGETLAVGETEIDVIHTPGHTTGMTAFKVGDVLFTGDGLFLESVARPDLEDPDAATAAARTLHETLTETIQSQDEETRIAPAHFSDTSQKNGNGYTAEFGTIRAEMDALELDEEAFVEFIVEDMPPRPANYEEIVATNLGQQSPPDYRAFQLELGPNNCAATDETLTN